MLGEMLLVESLDQIVTPSVIYNSEKVATANLSNK